MTGNCVSVTTIVTLQEVVFPLESVAVNVTIVVPTGKLPRTISPKLVSATLLFADCVLLTIPTLSDQIGFAIETKATHELGPATKL